MSLKLGCHDDLHAEAVERIVDKAMLVGKPHPARIWTALVTTILQGELTVPLPIYIVGKLKKIDTVFTRGGGLRVPLLHPADH